MTSFDPSRLGSAPVRALFALRGLLGSALGWDAPTPGGGPTLLDRVPADLRDSAPPPARAAFPFTPLYATADEWAAEIANRTVHGVIHLGWVADGEGRRRGQMAVLVKRNGRLGAVYMAAIAPFRHFVVYPAMLRQIGREWRARAPAG